MQIGDAVVYVESRGPGQAARARRHNALVVAIHTEADAANGQPVIGLAYCSPHEADTVPHGRVVFRIPRIAWCEDEATLSPLPSGAWPAYYVLPPAGSGPEPPG